MNGFNSVDSADHEGDFGQMDYSEVSDLESYN